MDLFSNSQIRFVNLIGILLLSGLVFYSSAQNDITGIEKNISGEISLPFSEDWSSGSFGVNWTHGSNWVINGQIGHDSPSAEFKWDPILFNYQEALTSDSINGVYNNTANNLYVAGRFILGFDIKLDNVNASGNEKVNIEIYNDSTWVIVASYNNGDGSFDWLHQEIDITDEAFGRVFKIRFVAMGSESSDILSWFLDNVLIERRCYPPQDLEVCGLSPYEMFLSWSPPYTPNNNTWIHWDDGTHVGGIGLTGGGVFSVASHWDPDMLSDYHGQYLSKIRFIPSSLIVNTTFTIKVWSGPDAETLLYEEAVSVDQLSEWNEFTLDPPVAIDVSQELWFGYTCDSPDGEHPAGYDSGPATVGYGDMITLDGVTWDPISSFGFDLNWNLQAFITDITEGTGKQLKHNEDISIYRTPDNKPTACNDKSNYVPISVNHKLIPGYHIYFYNDGADYVYIGRTQDTFFTHHYEYFSYYGLYCYYVKAVFEDCDADSWEACWIHSSVEDEKDEGQFRVFPIPARDLLNIESAIPLKNITVLDLNGRILQKHDPGNQNRFLINVSSLQAGVYLLRMYTDDRMVVKKILVE